MVPEITTPHSFKRALNYNEKKVQKGTAELLHAGNFLKLPEELNFYDKLERFEDLMELNDRAKTKTIHISLNFHPSEKERLTKEFLVQLAGEYMEKIGFGNQPYLVYQHYDAAHPHVHVLSTLIKEDGKRIPTHNIGKDTSERVRKEMEQTYGLVSADKKEYEKEQDKGRVVNAQKVQYGTSETRRSITNVLDAVVEQYKYTSLAELNAVLRQYNVLADRGKEDGRIWKMRGLTYRVLDEQGQKTGVPIKASSIYSKPTLDKLEKKMEENKLKREPDKKHLKTAIEWAMQSNPRSLPELAAALQKERVTLVIRRNESGQVFGMTYIDHEKKTVFNGRDIAKEYAAKQMLEHLRIEQQPEQQKERMQTKEQQQETAKQPGQQQAPPAIPKERTPQSQRTNRTSDKAPAPDVGKDLAHDLSKGVSKMIDQVIEPDQSGSSINRALTEEEKRRRRRQQQNDQEI